MIGKMVIEGVERTISEGMNPRVNHTHEQWILCAQAQRKYSSNFSLPFV